MVFDRSKEPKFNSKINVIRKAAFFDANGVKQNDSQEIGEVTVFEVKEINDQIFYRVGGQKQWILKANTDQQVAAATQPKIEQKADTEKYDLALKKGLTLQQGSSLPTEKEMRKLFKNGQSFPETTKFEWIYAPDTNQSKYTNAKLKITFPDGSSKEHSVHYNIIAAQPKPKLTTVQPQKTMVKLVNPQPRDLNFDFIKQSQLAQPFGRSIDEAMRLYQQAYYKQMSNTIRQGLEILTNKLLQLNQINPGSEWARANLSNQLGYIAFLKILPQRIMNLCFTLKNYGNIGSHHNQVAQFTQASALTVLQQYHDLLAYLVNTYQNMRVPYADVLITDEQNKHRNWYQRPNLKTNYLTFAQYMAQKNQPTVQTVPQASVRTNPQPEAVHEKMSSGMKLLLTSFVVLGLIIIGGIGYEVYQMNHNSVTTTANKTATSLKEQAANLSVKQTVALSVLYANQKLDDQWQSAYAQLNENNYNIDRYDQYTFGDATVSAQGNNYVYVLEKEVGFGYQNKSGNRRLVIFFDPDQDDPEKNPMHVYTYQMLESVSLSKVNKLAKKITFTDNEQG